MSTIEIYHAPLSGVAASWAIFSGRDLSAYSKVQIVITSPGDPTPTTPSPNYNLLTVAKAQHGNLQGRTTDAITALFENAAPTDMETFEVDLSATDAVAIVQLFPASA